MVFLQRYEANLNVLVVQMSKASDINMSETIATVKKKAEFEKKEVVVINATRVKHNYVVQMKGTFQY